MKYKIHRLILFITLLFSAQAAFGAEFILNCDTKAININDEFQIDLLLNTEGERANAFEGKIVFPSNLVEVKEIRDGNSIVNFWIEKPKETNSAVSFSGITPGGYSGIDGHILSVVFLAKNSGNANIYIQNGSLLKNDGEGSSIPLKQSSISLQIGGSIGGVKAGEIKDTDQPETFSPEVSQDPNILDNKWFVVFIAEDKGSGVDKYEVRESKYRIFNFSKWQSAESPYVLTDQELQSFIYIKAYDKSGNARIIRLSPKKPIPWYENIEDWFIIIIVVIVTLILFFKYKKKK